MLSKRPDLPFLLSAAAAALLLLMPSLRRSYMSRARRMGPRRCFRSGICSVLLFVSGVGVWGDRRYRASSYLKIEAGFSL
jgi:hypothetical protein